MSERSTPRIHRLVPPLGLGVVTLFGAAIVIGFGNGESTPTAATTRTHPATTSPTTAPTTAPTTVPTTTPTTAPTTTTTPTTTATTTTTEARRVFRGGKVPPRRRTGPQPLVLPPWLARELGPRSAKAKLVRKPSQNLTIDLRHRGFTIRYGPATLTRFPTRVGKVGAPQKHVYGVVRRNGVGDEATAVRGNVTSAYIVVTRRQGPRVWTWHLDTNLKPRIRADGAVVLAGRVGLLVEPPLIYDRAGEEITTVGRKARFRLAKEGSGWRLSLPIDDRVLPIPYVIAG